MNTVASEFSPQLVGILPNEAEEWLTIASLTRAMARSEERAWVAFHERFFDRLYRYSIVVERGDETTAADVVQQAMLRVVRHIRRFESEEVFWSWLTCLARCAAADAGRKRTRQLRLMEQFSHWQETRRAGNEDSAASIALLDECLAELNADERALIEGKYFDRQSYQELAVNHGLTPKAVESKLARLRNKLRASLTTQQR